jgi:hypothetical protein
MIAAMKQRQHKRRKQFRQPPKRLPAMPPGQTSTELPRRASNAVLDIGTPDTSLPLREAAAGYNVAGGETELTVGRTAQHEGGATKLVIESRLTEQPAAIRDIARALSKEFKSQANELKQQRPNHPDRIAQRDNLVVLLEKTATGFANLADNLDQAIRKGSTDKPEPVFLGKAAEVVQRLHFGLMEWLEDNRTAVFEVPFRVGIFLTGVAFLHSLGADSATAIGALGLLVKSTASKKKGGKK